MLLDPCKLGTAAVAPVVVFLFVTRRRGVNGIAAEQRALAAVLALMPFIYVMRAFGTGVQSSFWLEALGVPLFCAIAVLGLVSSPWYLVVGLASHGIAWDAWHHARCSYVPAWYSACCLIVDFALAGYVASRIAIYNRYRYLRGNSRCRSWFLGPV